MSILKDTLLLQLSTSWALTSFHLDGLTTSECLWRPASQGLHVHLGDDGAWRADWPEHERYDLGPSSIAWTTWHLVMWWSLVLDHSFGAARLTRDDVVWPGSADAVRASITALHDRWRQAIADLDDDALRATARSKWPLVDVPFADIVAWANLELMKNAAELGATRFLHAVRATDGGDG